ncbi:MAG TPA: hypothetical protein VEK33_15635 [Terriglobales bacterium]|nr:hypothetical protein [Terriglobales bacterium]
MAAEFLKAEEPVLVFCHSVAVLMFGKPLPDALRVKLVHPTL